MGARNGELRSSRPNRAREYSEALRASPERSEGVARERARPVRQAPRALTELDPTLSRHPHKTDRARSCQKRRITKVKEASVASECAIRPKTFL